VTLLKVAGLSAQPVNWTRASSTPASKSEIPARFIVGASFNRDISYAPRVREI
jgi:hypothetical protein